MIKYDKNSLQKYMQYSKNVSYASFILYICRYIFEYNIKIINLLKLVGLCHYYDFNKYCNYFYCFEKINNNENPL